MSETPPPADVQATFAATLVDEWRRCGLTHAVVCPGSRSTPLAVALARSGLAVHVHHDERSAAFVALGVGRATGRPAVVLTTSGTAAVELHPAVVEAHHDAVPLIAATADRPGWLRGTGAPQTIDQRNLYGSAVRAFLGPGVARWDDRREWRGVARAAWRAAVGGPPGPVQLNLELDEPLLGAVADIPAADRPEPASEPAATVPPWPAAVELSTRGVIVAGGTPVDPAAVHGLAEAAGWPVLADPRSGARVPGARTVAHFDALLRHPGFAAAHRPDVVLQLGGLPASRVLSEWLAAADGAGTRRVVVDPWGRRLDPSRSAAAVVAADATELCARLAAAVPAPRAEWAEAWAEADRVAADTIAASLEGGEVSEPAVARTVVRDAPDGATVVAASSMPVRDVEWYAAPRAGVRIVANRGANGIDGVVSTAVGVALGSGGPVVALVGDLALLHDTNALLGLGGRGADVRIVVVDNRGGGIFSFLPQAAALAEHEFELLLGTPHAADLSALAAAHGVAARRITDVASLVDRLGERGPWLAVARTDRAENASLHARIHEAVAGALG